MGSKQSGIGTSKANQFEREKRILLISDMLSRGRLSEKTVAHQAAKILHISPRQCWRYINEAKKRRREVVNVELEELWTKAIDDREKVIKICMNGDEKRGIKPDMRTALRAMDSRDEILGVRNTERSAIIVKNELSANPNEEAVFQAFQQIMETLSNDELAELQKLRPATLKITDGKKKKA